MEKALEKWLTTDAGKEFLQKIIKKELSRVLNQIEQEVVDKMQKQSWDEDSDDVNREVF